MSILISVDNIDNFVVSLCHLNPFTHYQFELENLVYLLDIALQVNHQEQGVDGCLHNYHVNQQDANIVAHTG